MVDAAKELEAVKKVIKTIQKPQPAQQQQTQSRQGGGFTKKKPFYGNQQKNHQGGFKRGGGAVSYTHLTLPTICSV